ncbi:MAG: hypothetical protein L6R35_002516 [Caloplaca aegaea]|nr:MAG: hypothetical protein L6R35_002516 [Caloplaca aegaea]
MNESILQSPQLQPEDMMLDHERDDASDSGISKEVTDSSEEILVEQARALGVQFDYDGSVLTPEQRRALFKKYFAMHLELFGLRSPRYYEGKSQCLSVAETAWPGAVGYVKAMKLKQGYIEPEDLIQRLRKLKPSDNFEPRKYRHPLMSWKSPTPLREKAYTISFPEPDWLLCQIRGVRNCRRRLGNRRTDRICREIIMRWDEVTRDIEQTPTPNLHLLRDMGHSPSGTLFPWYLVKGLMALREEADYKGDTYHYEEEFERAMVKREEVIDRWRERNPDKILADHPVSIYRAWPADLMIELDEIDREAIRCGRGRYIALLRETEKKMQDLVAFYRDCGLITDQRIAPASYYQDPKANAERLPIPPYLKERFDAAETELGYHTDKGQKLRMIETSRWIESVINGGSEPTASGTPLPQSLLNELDIVWRDRNWLDDDDTEDEMIARIRQWRKSKHQQRQDGGLHTSPQLGSDIGPEEPVQKATSLVCSGQKNVLRDSALGLVTAPEGTRQLRENLSRGACRQPRTKITMAENQAIWRNRLRPRSDAVVASRDRAKATKTQTGKPSGITKRRKASKRKRPAAAERQATTFNTRKADPWHPSDTKSLFNESSLLETPGSVAKARGTKNLRRQSPGQASAAQPQGVQKIRNGKSGQTRGLMGAALTAKRDQGPLYPLTPPQS